MLLGLVLAAFAFGRWAQSRTPDSARDVLRCGDQALTNQDLAYYYWSEYYVLVNEGSSLDPDKAPAAQTADDGRTWDEVLTERALLAAQDTLAHVCAAEDAGFTLPEEYRAAAERMLDALRETAAAFEPSGGEDALNAYLRAVYGPDADEERYAQYLEQTSLAAAYAAQLEQAVPEPDEETVRRYYEARQQDFPDVTPEDAGWRETVAAAMREEQARNDSLLLTERYPAEVDREAIVIPQPEGLFE